MLFASGDTSPSLVLVRDIDGLRSAELARLLLEALSAGVADLLTQGAIAGLRLDRVRIRPLPLRPAVGSSKQGHGPATAGWTAMPSTHPTSKAERRPSLALGAPSLYGRLSAQLRSGSSERLIHPAGDGSEMGAVMPWKAPAEAARGCGHFALTQR